MLGFSYCNRFTVFGRYMGCQSIFDISPGNYSCVGQTGASSTNSGTFSRLTFIVFNSYTLTLDSYTTHRMFMTLTSRGPLLFLHLEDWPALLVFLSLLHLEEWSAPGYDPSKNSNSKKSTCTISCDTKHAIRQLGQLLIKYHSFL